VRSYLRDLRSYAATRWWVPFIIAIVALIGTAVSTEMGRDDLAHLSASLAWAMGLFGCVVALASGVGR
jgi:hypothetical protein